MGMEAGVLIDHESCNLCGICTTVCPSETLKISSNRLEVQGRLCIGCGHCYAACPQEAISIASFDGFSLEYCQTAARYLPEGQGDLSELLSIMKSRRSMRAFLPQPIPEALLQDLIKIACTAPSGTNSQKWHFTILPGRKEVEHLGNEVAKFYEDLNKMAESSVLRIMSRLFLKDLLGQYHRRYYKVVKEGLRQYRQEGRDRLFFGAPAVILVSSRPKASCPAEDALLASQNLLLAAHCLGLGTCLIGFVTEAMKHKPKIKEAVGLPRDEKVYSAIAIGKPALEYKRFSGRRKPHISIFSLLKESTAKD